MSRRKLESQPIPSLYSVLGYVTDTFWAGKVAEVASGNPPSGFLFDGQHLAYQHGKRNARVLLSSDPWECVQQVINFLYKNGVSPHQGVPPRISHGEALRRATFKSLSARDRSAAVNRFAERLLRDFAFPSELKVNLQSLLAFGISNGNIPRDRIQFHQGEIVGVEGLIVDTEAKKFLLQPTTRPNAVDNVVNVSDRKDTPVFQRRWKDHWTFSLAEKLGQNGEASSRPERSASNNETSLQTPK